MICLMALAPDLFPVSSIGTGTGWQDLDLAPDAPGIISSMGASPGAGRGVSALVGPKAAGGGDGCPHGPVSQWVTQGTSEPSPCMRENIDCRPRLQVRHGFKLHLGSISGLS